MAWAAKRIALLVALCASGCNALDSRLATDSAGHAAVPGSNGNAAGPDTGPRAGTATATVNHEAAPAAPARSTTPVSVVPATPLSNAKGGPDPKAMAEVMAEVQALGVLDRDSQNQLLKDLQQTDPVYWPQMVQVVRASVAYRKQAMQNRAHDGTRDDRTEIASAAQDVAGPRDVPEPAAEESPKRTKPAGRHRIVADTSASRRAEPPARAATDDSASNSDELSDDDDPRAARVARSAPAEDEDENPPSKKTHRAEHDAARSVAQAETRGEKRARPKKEVEPASYAEPAEKDKPDASTDWKGHLERAARSLEAELANHPDDAQDATRQATLRMLYLMSGRRDDAIKPIHGLPSPQQDFWSKELYGLNIYLDAQRNTDNGRRAAEANGSLREASNRLAELAPLQVHNPNFCTEVQSYGVYKKFDKYDFKPGQEVLLYAEVENFVAEQTPRGFHTALKTSYQIIDSRGNRVADQEFPLTEEYCQNIRRDFFVRYFIYVPKQIYNGQYTLQLSIEDTTGHKVGQTSLDFTLKDGAH
ncbi:MAG TPA: hypothetical protein VFE24_05955 [Pirellulales bacterium]|jgi:hypothetical protein|nr:hypothetical protein [Pirellulales bacterium]